MPASHRCIADGAGVDQEKDFGLGIFEQAPDAVPFQLCSVLTRITAEEVLAHMAVSVESFYPPGPVQLVVSSDITVTGVINDQEVVRAGIVEE